MMKAGNIKVMIADDESIVRKGLRSTVPWERFGMEVVADSPNGQAAWEAFGVSAAGRHYGYRYAGDGWDRALPEGEGGAPETRIILLSRHRDFEYAQEGMRLGASGYLLKTAFEDEELEAMLGKFQRELSDAPANGYGLEEQVSAHLFAWLNGHSDHFPGELRKLCDRVGLGEGKPISLYLIKTAGRGGSWERLLGEQGSEEPGARPSGSRTARTVAIGPWQRNIRKRRTGAGGDQEPMREACLELAGRPSGLGGCAESFSILAQGSRAGAGVRSERRAVAGADPAGDSSAARTSRGRVVGAELAQQVGLSRAIFRSCSRKRSATVSSRSNISASSALLTASRARPP